MALRHYYERQKAVARDWKKLKDLRKPRDRRRKPATALDKASHLVTIKRTQFDLALHRAGLVSPFDYEYPRLKNMSQLAQRLYDRHLAVFTDLWRLEELLDMIVWAARGK
jgi:hypothetical protein